jgi:arylsulfatase A-like enzyme
MNRREFVSTLGLASLAAPFIRCGSSARKARDASTSNIDGAGYDGGSRRPNIVFIMSDDHGSQAVSCYGRGLNHTPRIDQIAQEGVRFDNCFCTNAICAPSRAGILTGKYSHINGQRNNSQVFDGSQETFPKTLQAAGYETALLGKWPGHRDSLAV